MGSNKYFEDQVFDEQSALSFSDSEYLGCQFRSLQMLEANFSRAKFVDCKFENCNFSNGKLFTSSFRSVSFHNCKLMGINWSNVSSFFELQFENSQLDFCVFQGMKMPNTKFEKCSLKDADFSDAQLKGSSFAHSNLANAFFSKCDLEKTDFRYALNYSVDVLNNRIKGATFSLPEAMSLLAPFEVKIE